MQNPIGKKASKKLMECHQKIICPGIKSYSTISADFWKISQRGQKLLSSEQNQWVPIGTGKIVSDVSSVSAWVKFASLSLRLAKNAEFLETHSTVKTVGWNFCRKTKSGSFKKLSIGFSRYVNHRRAV